MQKETIFSIVTVCDTLRSSSYLPYGEQSIAQGRWCIVKVGARYNRGVDLIALGIAVGLASVAGVRAFLPLALAALFSALGLFDLGFAIALVTSSVGLFGLAAPIIEMSPWLLFALLSGLAAIEVVLDKVGSVERGFNYAMIPVRAAAGAGMFVVAMVAQSEASLLEPMIGEGALSLPGELATLAPWMVAGALIAGGVAVLKVVLRPRAASGGAGVSNTFLSLFEDVVVVVGGTVGFVVPLLPLLLVAFLLFFFNRVRRRRGRKYEGLRILRD